MPEQIIVRGARLHNLQNITVAIPKNQLTVLTGVSGSGKSTFGLDILYREGMRQYIEALSLLPLGFARPPVDSISGLSPAISLDQHLINRNPRSTVGTSTDLYTYLRVLFARLGHRRCSVCGGDVAPPVLAQALTLTEIPMTDSADHPDLETYPCPYCGSPMVLLDMAQFSFNKPEGACPQCAGLGVVRRPDADRLIDREKSIQEGAVVGWTDQLIRYHCATLQAAAAYYGFAFDLTIPVKALDAAAWDLLLYGVQDPQFARHFPGKQPPPLVKQGRFEGIVTNLLRRHAEHMEKHAHDDEYHDRLEDFLSIEICPECAGTRLRAESRAVSLMGQTICELSRYSITDLGRWIDSTRLRFGDEESIMANGILDAMGGVVRRLEQVGAGYLTIERSSPSLSAGEGQRLRLAALLGSGLSGVLYVLDEPTIGLHPQDTQPLINILQELRDLGNTVLVIEHDLAVIAAADYVVDFGPGGGKHGGQVVAAGIPAEIIAAPGSVTGSFLGGRCSIPLPEVRRHAKGGSLIIHGARAHNLKNITTAFPLGCLTAVTGVSGSGKSTLLFDVLEQALNQRFYHSGGSPGVFDALEGCDSISRVISIDQSPIGRIPRSTVATYADVFMLIRKLFAAQTDARRQGLTASHFSLNMPGGRCEHCQGMGVLSVSMHFLPDAEVRCPVCHGRRYRREVLDVRYHEHTIAQVLDLTIEEALAVFCEEAPISSRLRMLTDVGLGYTPLGQSTKTLSGGEAQRVKLAKELKRRGTGHTLYLLDEPTTGLHLADLACLLAVLQRLVEVGNSVVVIEHNVELVKIADWVIDLGPGGGDDGGQVIAAGTPEQVAMAEGSVTGRWLASILRNQ